MKSAGKIAVSTALACLALAGCGGSKGATSPSHGTSGTTRSTEKPAVSPAPTAGSSEVSPGLVRASARGVTATMRLPGHHPRVNAGWPIALTVRRAGSRVKAEVRYQYLFAGQVVARRSHYRFTGSFHDVFRWPASAVGYPLTFRAAILAGGVALNLDYPVQVQR